MIRELLSYQECKLFANKEAHKVSSHICPTVKLYAKSWTFFQRFEALWSYVCALMWKRDLNLSLWLNICWRSLSWMSWMSHRRTFLYWGHLLDKFIEQSQSLQNIGYFLIPHSCGNLAKSLNNEFLQSYLIWPRNERDINLGGWGHCTHTFCIKNSHIEFSLSVDMRVDVHVSSFVTLKNNIFLTTFNLQSCNRYKGLLCPLFWPWATQDNVKTGENW